MKKIISHFLFLFLTTLVLHAQVNNVPPNVIPAVRQWQPGYGSFAINANTAVKYKPSELTQRTVAIFLKDLHGLQGMKPRAMAKSNARKNYIIIKITPKQQLSKLQKESYSMEIKPGRIVIKA